MSGVWRGQGKNAPDVGLNMGNTAVIAPNSRKTNKLEILINRRKSTPHRWYRGWIYFKISPSMAVLLLPIYKPNRQK